MTAWVETLMRVYERGEPAVLVTVAATKGSTPREAGTAMVVTASEVHGTIGGGHLEFQAIEIARNLFRELDTRQMRRFPLGASLGQCCGGIVELLFERIETRPEWLITLSQALDDEPRPFMLIRETTGSGEPLVFNTALDPAPLGQAIAPTVQDMLSSGDRTARLVRDVNGSTFLLEPLSTSDFVLCLFGAGHVGRALVRALSGIDCRVVWVDERSSEFPESIPDNVVVESPDAAVDLVHRASAGTYFLVMTHSHALDFELSEAILRRGDFRWFGLIGSMTKRRRFEHRLVARGLPASALTRMVCPIGIEGIGSKEPAAIAIAVAAQMLKVHEASRICGREGRSDDYRTATRRNR